jgi:hypothetical protein
MFLPRSIAPTPRNQQLKSFAVSPPLFQSTHAAKFINDDLDRKAPIATSGDNNVYIAWWNNKTGNDEVMFKASTGKTFSDKMNLSNSTNAESQDAEIAAAGSNVYVSWWERNQTSNEPVLRISNEWQDIWRKDNAVC